MKLERISENQIRCTLTRSDLAERELKISELAYGTEKAKALFREMMVQASDELGFEADNIPLIIEAVPVSNECIMLIVTKVEDPEELDTRFSKFTPSPRILKICQTPMMRSTATQMIFLTSSSVWAAIFYPRPLNYTVFPEPPISHPIQRQPAAMLPLRMKSPRRPFCGFMNSGH